MTSIYLAMSTGPFSRLGGSSSECMPSAKYGLQRDVAIFPKRWILVFIIHYSIHDS